MGSLDFSQQGLTCRLLGHHAGCWSSIGIATHLAQPPSHPEHPAATSSMRLKLAPTGRALEHDRMIRASLERRHHLQRNDFSSSLSKCAITVVEYDGGKSEAVRQGKVLPHEIGVIALVQRRKSRMLALLDYARDLLHDFDQIA